MEDRDILIEALLEGCPEPTEEEINRLDADLTKIAQSLFDYFIEQNRRGKRICDLYLDGELSHERNNLRSRVRSGADRRHES